MNKARLLGTAGVNSGSFQLFVGSILCWYISVVFFADICWSLSHYRSTGLLTTRMYQLDKFWRLLQVVYLISEALIQKHLCSDFFLNFSRPFKVNHGALNIIRATQLLRQLWYCPRQNIEIDLRRHDYIEEDFSKNRQFEYPFPLPVALAYYLECSLDSEFRMICCYLLFSVFTSIDFPNYLQFKRSLISISRAPRSANRALKTCSCNDKAPPYRVMMRLRTIRLGLIAAGLDHD